MCIQDISNIVSYPKYSIFPFQLTPTNYQSQSVLYWSWF